MTKSDVGTKEIQIGVLQPQQDVINFYSVDRIQVKCGFCIERQ